MPLDPETVRETITDILDSYLVMYKKCLLAERLLKHALKVNAAATAGNAAAVSEAFDEMANFLRENANALNG